MGKDDCNTYLALIQAVTHLGYIFRANILLGNDYQAKLGDFGLIRVQKLENNGHTNTTVDVHGTTMYMPPEAMTGKVSTKWDIYSFGVVC